MARRLVTEMEGLIRERRGHYWKQEDARKVFRGIKKQRKEQVKHVVGETFQS